MAKIDVPMEPASALSSSRSACARSSSIARKFAGFALLGAVGSFASTANAHMDSNKYLHIQRSRAGLELVVDIDTEDAGIELGLGEGATPEAVLSQSTQLKNWLERGLTIRTHDGPCPSEVGPAREVRRDGRSFLSMPMKFRCAPGDTGWVLRDDTLYDEDPQHLAIVDVAFSGAAGATILSNTERELPLDGPPGSAHLVWVFVLEGAMHLFTGFDHMLFLLSLLLGAGYIARDHGTRAALRDVAVLVSAFTVGHSLTLVSAALGWVVLPSRVVETGIAASIALVALANLLRPGGRRGMPSVAFFFGLIHGFGFSSVLAALHLPMDHRVLALLSFNIGIELAQLLLVAVVIQPLVDLSRWRGFEPVVVRGGSLGILVISLYWMITRALAV